jgi:hypothetical protein
MHRCDQLDGLSLLLFFDLLLVLLRFVFEILHYLIFDLLLPLIIEAKSGTSLRIFATLLAAALFLSRDVLVQAQIMLVNLLASLLIKSLLLLFVRQTLFTSATQELLLKEFASVWVDYRCGVGIGGTL